MQEVVAALIWDGDKVMICQRPAHKARPLLWEFPGIRWITADKIDNFRFCSADMKILQKLKGVN
ncbi:MAG TPA: hypothetical protein GXX72_03535 [Clostridiaceae bacterium]|jgi:hypothetical protein|nr:hypothetical protein [Clostridiaceae bacterium]